MRLTYAHQVRLESDCLPFEIRAVEVQLRVFPPDDIDDDETYQVMLDGKPISDALDVVQFAFDQAAYNLMAKSREQFARW